MKDAFCIPTTFLDAVKGITTEQKLASAEIEIAALKAQVATLEAANAGLTALIEHVTTATIMAKG